MKIMSMDVGDKRIGMALSDVFGWTAQGLDTLERRYTTYDLEKIKEVIEKHRPDKFVLGLPKNMNGSVGPQGDKVKEFGELLKSTFHIDVIYWDERLTTVSAHQVLISGNVRRDKRKQKVDQLAAVLILQTYLDYINNQKEC